MLYNIQLNPDLVRKRDLKSVPIINALLTMTPAEIETEVRARVTSQAEAVTMLVHLTKLVALLMQLEKESREK